MKSEGCGIMKPRQLLGLLFLGIALASFGCAGMTTYQSGVGSASTMMDCNGDVPSPYPPYCHPTSH